MSRVPVAASGDPDAELRRLLRDAFHHDDFVGPQLDIMRHVLAGGDALVIMPTGGGKSLCYQLPALLAPGLTVVLSPLIALMQDQVDQLRARGVPATFINSSLDRSEREQRLADVIAGRFKLLYVTPERFRQAAFAAALATLDIALLAVDEAHCISAWGHDFRPEYGRLARIRAQLGHPPVIALTATATAGTQRDIREKLGIPAARLFHTGIERENLFLGVRPVADEEQKFARIRELIGAIQGPGIVYMALIKDLERLHERLLRSGFDALVYHGELPAADRRRVQRRFLESADAVIVATNAFGMGVDKADIRFIVHGQLPGSVEAYYQEIGRAGRDGRDSLCELLYAQEDLLIQKQFVEWANPDAVFLRNVYNLLESWQDHLYAHDVQELRETLLLKNRADGRVEMALGLLRAEGIVEGGFERRDLRIVRPLERAEEARILEAGKRERDLRRLLHIVEYARGERCRKEVIHEYFGFPPGAVAGCGACDVCVDTVARLAAMPGPRVGVAALRDPADAASRDAPVAVGDWIMIRGRFAVTVTAVRRQHHEWIAQAQSADDLKIRSYNLNRVPWQRI